MELITTISAAMIFLGFVYYGEKRGKEIITVVGGILGLAAVVFALFLMIGDAVVAVKKQQSDVQVEERMR